MKRNQVLFSIIAIVLLVWGATTLFKKDSYIGFYYPDASNLFNDIQSDSSFNSLDECRTWANEQKSIHNPDGSNQDDYECGKNCNLQNGQKPYVCEETLE
jgi:hypothetical protein